MRPTAPRPRIFSPVLPVALAALVACTASPRESGLRSSPQPVAETTLAPASSAGPAVRSVSASGPIDRSSLSGRIAFSAGPPHAEDVYIVDADGTNLVRVTDDPAADFDPTFAPDGARIAYRHQPGDDPTTDIYVVGSTGSHPRDLTPNHEVADWGPAWSPDGTEIAWNSERDTRGRFRGFLMRPTGGAVKPLGADVWVEYPAWSPDGSKLAFMAQTPEGSDNYEVFVVRADGTGLRRLTDSPGSDGWPSWSPDGTKILFSSVRDDCLYSGAPDCLSTGDIGPYHTLYVMDADGSGQARLSDAFGQIADWSPDGRYIVFGGPDGLSLIRADGTGLTTLPTGVGASAFPDWIA
jgi:TolB protein